MDTYPPLPPDDLFSTAQAYALGWTRRTLPEARRLGLCHPVLRGWHAHGPCPSDARAFHLETVRATHLEYGDRMVTSSVSACLWHGIAVDDRDLCKVILARRAPVDGDAPASHGRSTHRVLVRAHAEDVDLASEAPVLRPAAAVVEYLMQAGLPTGVAAADDALRQGLVTLDDLAEATERRRGRTRISLAQSLAAWVDPLAENPGESRARVALVRAGFRVESQVWITTPGGRYRPDWRVVGTAALIELDGAQKYVGADGSLLTDKVRRQRTRDRDLELTGHAVAHITMDDLLGPAELREVVVRQVREALQRPTPEPWREGRGTAPGWRAAG